MAAPLELMMVHVPKTGGRSLREALRAHYGEDLLFDYADRIANPDSPINADRDAFFAQDHVGPLRGRRAVIGHFWIGKYPPGLADITATVLREPVARAISHYFYWLGSSASPNNEVRNPLRRRLLTEGLSFEDFVAQPMVHDFYTGCYFRNVDMQRFDVIADQAELDRSWSAVVARLGLPALDPVRSNQTQKIVPDYAERRAAILDDTALMGRVRDCMSADLEFYERWRER